MFYYDFFRNFTDEEKGDLLETFNGLLENHGIWNDILCVI